MAVSVPANQAGAAQGKAIGDKFAQLFDKQSEMLLGLEVAQAPAKATKQKAGSVSL